jgi:hypothetical protein
MDGLREMMADLKRHSYAQGNLQGLLQILIGRHLLKANGTLISSGLTWRAAARLLKKVRWDPEAVRDLGIDPAALPPRDRVRFWYLAIGHAALDTQTAAEAGDRLAAILNVHGYVVGPCPR